MHKCLLPIVVFVMTFSSLFAEAGLKWPVLSLESSVAKTALPEFFAYLFCKEDFGYALIGAKPMSFTTAPIPNPLSLHIPSLPCTLYDSKNFLFRAWGKNGMMTIVLIHKGMLHKVYKTHEDLFEKTLHTISATDLLQRIATTETFFNSITNNDIVLGTLLGFGKENAMLFAREKEIFPHKQSMFPLSLRHCPAHLESKSMVPKALLPSTQFQTLEEEQAWFEKNFTGSYDPATFCTVDLVWSIGFGVIASEETKQLVVRYTKAKEILTALFSERSCFEVVKKQLQAARPLAFDEVYTS